MLGFYVKLAIETFEMLGFYVKFWILQGRSYPQSQRLVTAIPNILNKFNLTFRSKSDMKFWNSESNIGKLETPIASSRSTKITLFCTQQCKSFLTKTQRTFRPHYKPITVILPDTIARDCPILPRLFLYSHP